MAFSTNLTGTKIRKKLQKSGVCRCKPVIYSLYAGEKKSKNFFYIERYGNDLHRPTSFLFHRLEERSFSHTKQKHLKLLLYVNRHLPQSFSFIFVSFAPFQKATVTDCHKKSAKKPLTKQIRRGIIFLAACNRLWKQCAHWQLAWCSEFL